MICLICLGFLSILVYFYLTKKTRFGLIIQYTFKKLIALATRNKVMHIYGCPYFLSTIDQIYSIKFTNGTLSCESGFYFIFKHSTVQGYYIDREICVFGQINIELDFVRRFVMLVLHNHHIYHCPFQKVDIQN